MWQEFLFLQRCWKKIHSRNNFTLYELSLKCEHCYTENYSYHDTWNLSALLNFVNFKPESGVYYVYTMLC